MNFIKDTNKKGFTLVEIVVTTAIFSIIIGILTMFIRNIYYFNNVFSNGLTSYDDARKALQPIASEIRSASPSSLGAYPLEKTAENELIFFADINNDGLKEKIRYLLVGTTLRRGVTTPTGNPLQYVSANEVLTTIVDGVRNGTTPIFVYYNATYSGTGNSLAQPVSVLDVRLVKINIIIDADPNRPPEPVSVTTQISIRNLKDNL
jgi:prepilin-type N-terminal cleavage/methylation domain-containing protein